MPWKRNDLITVLRTYDLQFSLYKLVKMAIIISSPNVTLQEMALGNLYFYTSNTWISSLDEREPKKE